MRRPDFAEIERIRGIIQNHNMDLPPRDRIGPWRGQFQIDMMQAMIDNSRCIIQGIPQNSGKTYCASLLSCARILDGQNGVWCYPTLRQGARVAFRRIDNWMRILEEAEGVKRCMPDAAFEKAWENGGSIMVLSLDVSAKAGVQGYTLEFGFLDEAHEILQVDEVIGAIFTRFAIALQEGYGSITLLGVGGAKNSLIEQAKTLGRKGPMFKAFQYPWQVIYDQNPAARTLIDDDHDLLPDIAWRQFYELEPVSVGTLLILKGITEASPYAERQQPVYSIGIDVGKVVDRTVAVLLASAPSKSVAGKMARNVEQVFTVPRGLTFEDQARLITEWYDGLLNSGVIVLPSKRMVETNGIGDSLKQELVRQFWPCNGLPITDNEDNTGIKSYGLTEIMVDCQQGLLGAPHGLGVDRTIPCVHEHLAGLKFGTDENGRIEWEHSDVLSALLMAWLA